MLNSAEYSLGDGQTWVGYAAEPTAWELSELERYLGDKNLAAHLAQDGVRVCAKSLTKERLQRQMESNRGDLVGLNAPRAPDEYLLDTLSGLTYDYVQREFRLRSRQMLSPEHNVVDTCYFRDRLRGKAPGQGSLCPTTLFTGGAIDRYFGVAESDGLSFLNSPIVDYEARDVAHCRQIIAEIHDTLSKTPYYRRLWLRGQREEYFVLNRSVPVCKLLGLGQTGAALPSLLPSLGRYARDPKNTLDYSWVESGPHCAWRKPFFVWVIRSNPQWLAHYPSFQARIEEYLRKDDDGQILGQLLWEIRTDPRIPIEVDDLRESIAVEFKYSALIFVLQQYGYYSSMLDVTSDLDVALFFSQSLMSEGRMQKVDPQDGRVVYIFAEPKRTREFFDAADVMRLDADWASATPPRIDSQSPGALIGSTVSSQNAYAHWIVARIYLDGSDCVSTLSTNDLFPDAESDLLLRTLRDAVPPLESLY